MKSSPMFKEKLATLKTSFKERLNRYFPSVRGAALLIVIPAFFIVTFYFLTIIKEVIIDKKRGLTIFYEQQFAAVKPELPANKPVNYVSDQTDPQDFVYVRYVLVPARMVKGLKPAHDLLVVQYLDTAAIPGFKGYELRKNYGNGVMLFKRVGK
jgi:hypothetical protein